MTVETSVVDRLIADIGSDRGALIPILQAIQSEHNYLPEPALRRIYQTTDISPADVEGVVSFYDQFRRVPAGKHLIKVCVGTACHIKGSDQVYAAIQRSLNIPKGEDTDSDRVFTIAKVACLGCCTLAPAVQIDDITYGYQTPITVDAMLSDFLHAQASRSTVVPGKSMAARDQVGEIRITEDSCCIAGGTTKVREALERAVATSGVNARVKRVGCVGMCHQIPLVEILMPDATSHLYAHVKPSDADRIVARHFPAPGPMAKLKARVSNALLNVLTDEVWEPVTRYSIDVRDTPVCEFLGKQKYIAAEHFGQIDPLDMEEYAAHDGFVAMKQALASTPEEVIETITQSGLRGRGGAGFPAGLKWRIVRDAPGDPKSLVMNGDEGDPGAFMDRMLLESYPYRALEGVAIAAFAVGAHEAVLYIRHEYPFALDRVRKAISNMQEGNLLGTNILGSGFDLSVRIMEGAGAFVCGEETALLASIEGKRGMPRIRPPYPAINGLNGRPTLINNVETFACVPWIVRNGSQAFAALGSDTSNGTKVFSLAGKIARGGLIEVPMGISIDDIVQGIGGGAPEGRTFKAVQIGGPSGGCIPAELGHTLVDYDLLTDAGAIMGSGGLVVLDDTDCMVDIARYFLQFTQEQSCGKCTFCRVGTKRMLEILERLCEGNAGPDDLERLEELCEATTAGSLCGLGKTAANPVLTTLRYFRSEYEAHVRGQCPALKCKALVRYTVNDKCIGCTRCAQRCPVDAINSRAYEKHEIDVEKCVRCDSCRQACPEEAITMETGE